MNITSIVGARPQFVKASTISSQIKIKNNNGITINEKLIHTGQHYDNNLSSVFFKELDLPEISQNLEVGGGFHGSNTGRMLIKLEEILMKDRPDGVIVYGDTNSTLAGVLASSKLNIKTFHIEAGIRSFNKIMPEEKNRIVADHLSDICFTPTEFASSQLINEGIDQSKIVNTGDVMYDAHLSFSKNDNNNSYSLDNINFDFKQRYILLTIHREENTDNINRLTNILKCISYLSKIYKGKYSIVVPLHPRTKNKLAEYDLLDFLSEIIVIKPVGYFEMNNLEKNVSLIITDSGGVQKEAYFHSIPCVTIRTETEWRELLKTGWNILISPDISFLDMSLLIEKQLSFNLCTDHPQLYGDGSAAETIVNYIYNYLSSIGNHNV